MSVTRPTTYPDWCTTGTRTSPSGSEIMTGYKPDQIPPCEEHNWLWGFLGDWIRWLDQQEQLDGAQNEYDATVGTGGTYADINALIAAITGGAVHHKVLVTTPQTLASAQVITSAITDLWLVFLPQAVYTPTSGVATGMIVHGQRITVEGGRWAGFSGGGDQAIRFESDSKNCRATGINFASDCTTGLNDIGTNNISYGIMDEVA